MLLTMCVPRPIQAKLCVRHHSLTFLITRDLSLSAFALISAGSSTADPDMFNQFQIHPHS